MVQTDENGKYISIDGEKYYELPDNELPDNELPDNESKQNQGLKYYEVERNTTGFFELQF